LLVDDLAGVPGAKDIAAFIRAASLADEESEAKGFSLDNAGRRKYS
jgi:hypothetical protein